MLETSSWREQSTRSDLSLFPSGFLGSVLTRRSAHAREAAQACVLGGLSPENLALCSLILLHSVLSSLVPSSQLQSVCVSGLFSHSLDSQACWGAVTSQELGFNPGLNPLPCTLLLFIQVGYPVCVCVGGCLHFFVEPLACCLEFYIRSSMDPCLSGPTFTSSHLPSFYFSTGDWTQGLPHSMTELYLRPISCFYFNTSSLYVASAILEFTVHRMGLEIVILLIHLLNIRDYGLFLPGSAAGGLWTCPRKWAESVGPKEY